MAFRKTVMRPFLERLQLSLRPGSVTLEQETEHSSEELSNKPLIQGVGNQRPPSVQLKCNCLLILTSESFSAVEYAS
jgi:hypothetical protein